MKRNLVALYRHQTSYFQSFETSIRNEMLSVFPTYVRYYDVHRLQSLRMHSLKDVSFYLPYLDKYYLIKKDLGRNTLEFFKFSKRECSMQLII